MPVPIIPLLEDRQLATLESSLISKSRSLSGGLLYDTKAGSALMGIISYNAQLLAEYGAALNLLPEATLRKWINVIGVAGASGTLARGEIDFTLAGLFSTPISITQGYRMVIGGVLFETTQTIVIPAFTATGRVAIVAVNVGSVGNIAQSTPVIPVNAIAAVASIALRDAIADGTNAPSLSDLAELTNLAIRQRSLNATIDFETKARVILGVGSSALAVKALGKDRITQTPGAVHVFGLNANRTQLSNAQIAQLQTLLAQDAGWATVFVSSMTVQAIDGFVVAVAASGSNPNDIATGINSQLRSLISPEFVIVNTVISVNRLVNAVFGVPGVQDVGRVSLGNTGSYPGVDWVQPNAWTIPILGALQVRLIQNNIPYEFNFRS